MKTSYRSARVSLILIEVFTWAAVAVAAIGSIFFFLNGLLVNALISGGGTALFAVFGFAAIQFARAQIDTADNTAAMLKIMLSNSPSGKMETGKASTSRTHDGRKEPTIKR